MLRHPTFHLTPEMGEQASCELSACREQGGLLIGLHTAKEPPSEQSR